MNPTRHPSRSPCRLARGLAALLGLWSGLAVVCSAQTNVPCTATLLNRSVQINPDGSFSIPNLPYQRGFFRVRIACSADGSTSGGQSDFISLTPGQATTVGPLTFGPLSPLPIALAIGGAKTNLATRGETVQLFAVATFQNGSTGDVSAATNGTLWTSSNLQVAGVSSNGLVTAVAHGVTIIQALTEGVQAAFAINVLIPLDSDGDGIPDDYEIAFGMNPQDPSDAALDFDGDGLTNLQEYQLGTNPRLADTDGDGIPDGQEVQLGLNPLKADTDGDGIADGEELRRGLNPLSADTDGDGIPDGLELQLGLNPLVADLTTRVQGRVLDTNGLPVLGATVVLFNLLTAQTDAAGSFSMPNIPTSLGPIIASAQIVRAGQVYDGASAAAAGAAGGLTDLGAINLRLDAGNVVGTVRDTSGGTIPGVIVTVSSGKDTRTVRTDGNGLYRVPNMTAGSITVWARDPASGLRGYAGGNLPLNQSVALDVRLAPLATVAGAVYGRDGVTPVGTGVTVTLTGPTNITLITDVLGKYRFEFVPIGLYTVDASDANGNRGRTSGEISATAQVRVADISFLGRGIVSGLVLNNALQPVPGAAVSLSSSSVFGGVTNRTSDGTGHFAFSNVFIGPFSLTAQLLATHLAGWTNASISQEGQSVAANVILAASGTITGLVFRADGTNPLAGARVALSIPFANYSYPTGLKAVTDSHGGYSFTFIPLGTYVLDATDPATVDQGESGAVLSAQGQVVVQNITMTGLGSVSIVVRNGTNAVSGAQVTLRTTLFDRILSGVANDSGTADLGLVIAGAFSVTALDPVTGLTGAGAGSVAVGASTNLTVFLQAAGSILGQVFLPDGVTAAPNVSMRVSPSTPPFFSRQQYTKADGSYRFDSLVTNTYVLEAQDNSGNRRAQVTNIVLNVAGQQATQNLTLSGVGTVTGIVRNPDASPALGTGVRLASQSPGASSYFSASTDVSGRYAIANVPLGPFQASAGVQTGQSQSYGSTNGVVQTNAQTVSADILLATNLVQANRALFDANNFPYDLTTNGSVFSGLQNVFDGNASNRGASLLELVTAGNSVPFAGQTFGTLLNGGREIAISQIGLAGLNVTRRVFVPREGYFARYLEVLSNGTPSSITVDLKLTSNFRFIQKIQGNLIYNREPRIVSTSSGDAILNVTNGPGRDRWVVIDDDDDVDPFRSFALPAVADVFDGTNGIRQAASASFAVDFNAAFGQLIERWTNVTIAPGASAGFLHFEVQQMTRAAAQTSATRLSQLAPEALTGLTPGDLAAIQNFAPPTNGISLLPALPALTGSIGGLVLAGDSSNVVANATVQFQSTNILYGRTYSAVADSSGRFSFLGHLDDGPASLALPINAFNLVGIQPLTQLTSPVTQGSFPAGNSTTQNVAFAGSGLLAGTVRRHNNVVVSTGTVRVSGPPLLGPATVGIAQNGNYGLNALPPDIYTMIAQAPLGQPIYDGFGGIIQPDTLTGAGSAPVVAGQTTIADIVIQATGNLVGTLRRTNGSGVVSMSIQLQGTNNLSRSRVTDTGGHFAFNDVPSGTVTLNAYDPGAHTAASAQATVLTDQTVNQDLTLSAGGTVIGQIRAAGGQPFPGAQVILSGPGGAFTNVAGADGSYRFDSVPIGNVTVFARDAGTGYRGFAPGFLAVAGQTLTIDVQPAAVGMLVGNIYRPDGLTPASGAIASVLGGALSGAADTNGHYSIDYVPVGTFTVSALHPASGETGSASSQISSNGVLQTANLVLMPALSIADASINEGNVGRRDLVFNLRLSFPSSQPASVHFATSNNTAVAGSDYSPTNGTLAFGSGITNGLVVVRVTGDTTVESNEMFFVNLSAPVNLVLSNSQAAGVVLNDDGLPGFVDHFAWDQVPSPQLSQGPFPVTLTARDAFNNTVTNFAGPVQLSAILGGPFSGTLLGEPSGNVLETDPFPGNPGYDFIPSTDILVTHVASYFGTKVTITTQNGTVLLAQPVASVPGTWVETPLQHPMLLTNGQRYTVSILVNSGVTGYRRIGLPNPFPHGTLNQSYQNPDVFGWWMVDLRYTPAGSLAVAMSPTNSGTFTKGVWSGNLTVLAPATNLVLVADDLDGHTGSANPLDVGYGNDVVISGQASPNPVPLGGVVTYAINVTNTGPLVATGVVVTNTLPPGFNLVSAFSPQEPCAISGQNVICAIGVVPRGFNATLTILAQATVPSSVLNPNATNLAIVARAEIDGYTGNNAVQTLTSVLRPTVAIADTSVREGNAGIRAAVFDVRLSYPSTDQIAVVYGTSNGTAVAASDYVQTSGTLYFQPGDTNRQIRVPILGDTNVEPDETFFVNLFGASSATLARNVGTGVILNDDGLTGQIDHFDWAAIGSPQFAGEPFAVALTAKNAANGTVSSFAGPVSLSGLSAVAGVTNLLLSNLPHTSSSSVSTNSQWTFGYSFTPNTNLLVTHVRRYFGDRISIWTDDGFLLASQNVTGLETNWTETALPAPLPLAAGVRYRISVHLPGGNFYFRTFTASDFPDGVLNLGYNHSGDGFPFDPDDGFLRWLVGMKYTIGTQVPISMSPTNTGGFTNGVWSGLMTVSAPATNVFFRADDGDGDVGQANRIDIALHNDISVSGSATPAIADIRSNLTYTIIVSNSGPTAANGVTITNLLPVEINLLSITPSQGSYSVAGRVVTCNLGTLPPAAAATLTLVVRPTLDRIVLTDIASVGRAGTDPYPVNNQVTIATSVNALGGGIAVAILDAEPDNNLNQDVRNKLNAFGFFSRVDIIPVGEGYPVPSLDQLQQYAALFVYSDLEFEDKVAMGDLLADYSDSGFGLVIATFSFDNVYGLGGRVVAGNYLPLTMGDYTYGNHLTLIADNPQHPLLQGVSSLDGGSVSWYSDPSTITPGSSLVAHWSNGRALVAVKQLPNSRTVGLNFFPPSSDADTDLWDSETDGARLMANALRWVMPPPRTLSNDLVLAATQAPSVLPIGGTIAYTLVVSNTGPSVATGVVLTNILPPGASLLTLNASQGTITNLGGIVVASLGSLGTGTNATVTLSVRALAFDDPTNIATVTRAEPDAYIGNNTAVLTAVVQLPGVAIDDASVVEGDSGSTNAVFAVHLSFPSPGAVSVDYATYDNSASAGTDYVATNGTLVFQPGQTNATVSVAVRGDTTYQGDRAFIVYLSNATNATLLRAQATGTILDNDPVPVLSINDISLLEGDMGTRNAVFTVTLSPGGGYAAVDYATANGSALSGSDYLPTNSTLYFAPGETNHTISVPVIGDRTVEPDETFFVTLSNPYRATLGKGQGRATILNDDGVSGQIDHFDWAAIPTPQLQNVPFPVTVAAKDSLGATVSNFAGPVALGDGSALSHTNTFFQNQTHIFAYHTAGEFTFGITFTPAVDLLVTHVRGYFGNKISIWAEDGTLIVAQPVFVFPVGQWTETALSNAITLTAGTRYRLGVHGGPNFNYYYGSTPGSYNPDLAGGYIGAGSYASQGDVFPTGGSIGSGVPFVDLKYVVQLAPRVAPSVTSSFTNGTWTGYATALLVNSNLALQADDGQGHVGVANPIVVLARRDLTVAAGPNPLAVSNTLHLVLAIRNSTASSVTGVTVTNRLPPGVNLLSVTPSQGTYGVAGSLITWNVGTLPPSQIPGLIANNSIATALLLVQPTAPGLLTNVAWAARNEPEPDPANNFVTNVIRVVASTPSIGYLTDGNEATTAPADPIARAGLTPVQIADITTFDLNSIGILFLDEFGLPPSTGLQNRLPDIQAWVNAGGVLVLHNAYGENTAFLSSLLAGVQTESFLYSSPYAVGIAPPGDTLVTAGPFGTLVDYDSAGYNSLILGSGASFAVPASLPASSRTILTAGGNVAAFSYPLGLGHVYYSAIPLDYYLEVPDARAVTNIYAPNVVAYAQSLFTSLTTPGTNLIRFDFGPGATGWTNGGFQLLISGLTGRGPVIIYASTNLVTWEPIYTNAPVVGTLVYIDTSASTRPLRFYRAQEGSAGSSPRGSIRFILGPGATSGTNGGFQLQISGLSGHGPVVILASTNLATWQPILTNPPVIGTLQYFDAAVSNRTSRFYRVLEQ